MVKANQLSQLVGILQIYMISNPIFDTIYARHISIIPYLH